MQIDRRADPPVVQLIRPSSFAASTEDPIDKVAADLERHRLFVAPVVNPDGSMFGVISSFAIAHVLATHQNAKAVRAWELCAYKPVAVSADTPLTAVAKLMVTKHLHYIVVEDGAKTRGIVSTFDFVDYYTKTRRSPPP